MAKANWRVRIELFDPVGGVVLVQSPSRRDARMNANFIRQHGLGTQTSNGIHLPLLKASEIKSVEVVGNTGTSTSGSPVRSRGRSVVPAFAGH